MLSREMKQYKALLHKE